MRANAEKEEGKDSIGVMQQHAEERLEEIR